MKNSYGIIKYGRDFQWRRLVSSVKFSEKKMIDTPTGSQLAGKAMIDPQGEVGLEVVEEEFLQTDKLMMAEVDPFQDVSTKHKTMANIQLQTGESSLQLPVDEIGPMLAQPFTDVPGPIILRALNRFWQYLPVVGTKVKFVRNIRPYKYLFNEYGPVVRLHGPFGGDMVMISHPEDIRAVYMREEELTAKEYQQATKRKVQVTALLDSMEAYRKSKPQTQIPVPILDIEALRELFKDKMVHHTEDYERMAVNAAESLINRMCSLRSLQEELPPSFIAELYTWSVDCVTRTLFNRTSSKVEEICVTEPNRTGLVNTLMEASQAVAACETGFQIWRLMPTFTWSKLSNSCDTLEGLFSRGVRLGFMRLDKILKSGADASNESLSFLESMILRENLSAEDVLTRVLDIFLIGVNTSVNTTGFLMYNLARNPKAQKILLKEVKEVLPHKDSTVHSIGTLNYLAASITETVRLNPPFPYVRRQVTNDTVIHGYTIPKGTYVVMANEIAFLREDNFEEAHKFKPERWLEGECANFDPLDVMPYCKTFPKQLLYQQIAVLIAKVIRNYKIEYNYGPITSGVDFLQLQAGHSHSE